MAILCLHARDLDSCKRAAERLASSVRRIDGVALGDGAELLVLLPEVDLDEATERAQDMLREVAELAPESRIGVAICPEDGGDIDSLLSAARAAAEASPPGAARAASELQNTMQVADQRIVVTDPAMIRLYKLIERLAQSPIPVLINGETGAGKELAAAAIHHWSPRRTGNLITVNCAALPETLIESELFGHERGAFSGAVNTKLGLFESASGGTLFLDEIGELPAVAQAKFLRALETKRITRVGGTQERAVDVRVVAATNRNLEQEVAQGRFRQDLYFRLSAATVMLLPLRERRRELPILARSFLVEACERANRPPMAIAVDAMHRLLAYGWPGNLRELRNTMDFVAATSSEPVLLRCHLPERMGAQVPPMASDVIAKPVDSPDRHFRPLEEELRELERSRMIEALAATGGFQNRAAELLAMPLRTFAAKIKLYGLSRRPPPTKEG